MCLRSGCARLRARACVHTCARAGREREREREKEKKERKKGGEKRVVVCQREMGEKHEKSEACQ